MTRGKSWIMLLTLGVARNRVATASKAVEAALHAVELAWETIQEVDSYQDAPRGSRQALVQDLTGDCTLKADNALRELTSALSKLVSAHAVALDAFAPRDPPPPAPAEPDHDTWPGPDLSPSTTDLI